MKIRLDAREIRSSGIGVYIQNIIEQLAGSEVAFEVLYREKDRQFFKDIAGKKQFNAPLYSIVETLLLPVKTIGSDVFWSPHYNVPIVNFASGLKVVTIHDVYHLAYYDTLSTFQKIYAKTMIYNAVNTCDLVFTVSHFSKNEIIKYTGCPAEKVHVIHNGVNFNFYNQIFLEEAVQSVMQKYNIASPYILFVGNIKPHKNLKNALAGFREFYFSNSSHGELKFVVAGKREGFITVDGELNVLLNDPFYKNQIQFIGWVANVDLPVLYRQATAFIFPSLYEGCGFPPLEAMAAGCPVISSDAACMPEIYDEAALYFNPTKPTAIAEAIYNVCTDGTVRASLVQKGYTQAKKYNWSVAVKQKVSLIEQYSLAKGRK